MSVPRSLELAEPGGGSSSPAVPSASAYRLLEAILDAVPNPLFVKDAARRRILVNAAWEEFTGLSRADVLGRTDYDFFPKEQADLFCRKDDEVFASGGTRQNEERVRDARGRERWVITRKSLLHDEQGSPVLVGVLTDITERREMEAEIARARDLAIESARLKSEFLANMSHEIRTPMNGVVGMAGLLRDTRLDSQQVEFVRTIQDSADSLLTVINDILDFSKVEAGKLRFDSMEFDLCAVVEGTVALLAEPAQAKAVEISSCVDARMPTALVGDPGRLRQVLTNLVGNAVKFTERGDVTVRAWIEHETDDEVVARITVKDTGVGIPRAAQPHVFEPFMQADGSTTRRFGGTGLGLAISQRLVRLMGGEIGFESADGEGSLFWFTTRLARSRGRALAAPPRPWPRLAELKVLIVDDHLTNRQILHHQLSAWGVSTVLAEGGASALAALQHAGAAGSPFDLAILDAHMPDMDGLAVARAIRADPGLSETCLVMMTSLSPGASEELRAAGLAATLTKPVKQAQLLQCLTSVLGVDAPPAVAYEPIAATAREEESLSRGHVLVAEDNVVNQRVAIAQLRRLGYRADVVANGRTAVEALEHGDYDLVLMDCQMPELDGYEATEQIRRTARDARPIIVAMTAHALEGEREKCLRAGMDDYLSKPIQIEALKAVLDRWLPEPRGARGRSASPAKPAAWQLQEPAP
jgi:PAS domain S-box-containing protein